LLETTQVCAQEALQSEAIGPGLNHPNVNLEVWEPWEKTLHSDLFCSSLSLSLSLTHTHTHTHSLTLNSIQKGLLA